MENKTEIMVQIVALLKQLIENENVDGKSDKSERPVKPVEMLTIKECSQAVKGLSEHTVRQLVAQKKIPFIRTGQGKRGKILISKDALLEYLGGVAR